MKGQELDKETGKGRDDGQLNKSRTQMEERTAGHGDTGKDQNLLPPSLDSSPKYPSYHEHKDTQKFCQALSGQEVSDSKPALDLGQELSVSHGKDTLSLISQAHNCHTASPCQGEDKEQTLNHLAQLLLSSLKLHV